jgi:hypothetical protein
VEIVVIGAKGLLEVGGKGSVVCRMVVVVPITVETVVPCCGLC